LLTKIPQFVIFLVARLYRQGRAMLMVSLLVKAGVMVVIAPVSLALGEWALRLSGQPEISNQALLSFLLSPVGLLFGCWVMAVYLFSFFLEQAGILSLLMQHDAGRRSVSHAMRMVLARALPLAKLALLQAAALSLFVAVALFVGRWLFGLFLADWDINYYWQQQRLSVWIYISGLTLILVPPALWLGHRWLIWWFAVPLALVRTQGFYRQLIVSEQLSVGFKWPICVIVSAWLGCRVGVLAMVLALALWGSEPLLGSDPHQLAVYAVLGAGALAMFLVSFLDGFIYSALQYFLFRRALFSHRSRVIRTLREQGRVRYVLTKPARLALGVIMFVALFTIYDDLMLFAKRLETPHQMVVVAHRGGGFGPPENSLEGLRKAMAMGADFSELDVQLTLDGHLFAAHDRDIGRATGHSLVVEQSTLADLVAAYEEAGLEAATLDDWLRVAKGQIGLDIEVKRYHAEVNPLPALQRALVGYAGPVLLTSLDEPLLRELEAASSPWPLGALIAAKVGRFELESSFDVVLMSAQWLTPQRILTAQQQNRQVWVWTVDEPEAIQRLFHLGVDGVITNQPKLALALIRHEQSLKLTQRLLKTLKYWVTG
jgi:glycerophosphoryl diester phosphodiesterase